MEGYNYDPDEYATISSESDSEKSLVPLEHEESVQILKPQVEYSELDDVFSEELDDLDLRDFFIEKRREILVIKIQIIGRFYRAFIILGIRVYILFSFVCICIGF